MEAIKSYVMCALMASAVAGILKNVSSGMRSFEKYIGLVCSLSVVIMLAVPFVSVVSEIDKALSDDSSSLDEKEESDSDNADSELYDKTITTYYAKAVENSLASIITSKFLMDREDFKVSANLTKDKNGNYRIEEIVIFLYSDIDSAQIEYYTENILCIETEIRRYAEK